MKVHQPRCPECGEPACGTIERRAGYAQFVGEPSSEAAVGYSGQNEDAPEGPDSQIRICGYASRAMSRTTDTSSHVVSK